MKPTRFLPLSALRTLLLGCLTLAATMYCAAQSPAVYLFDDFTQGTVYLKNKQFAKGRFNYDYANSQIHFLNGGTDMIVENLEDIDEIVIGEKSFVPYEQRFVEALKGDHATLLVDRKVHIQEHGKTGAMGIATHGKVESIDVNTRFQRVNGDHTADLHIYKQDVTYTYMMYVKSSWKPFRNESTFLKLFPKKEQDNLRRQIDSLRTDFSQPAAVLQLIDTVQ